MTRKKWQVAAPDKNAAQMLAESCGLNPYAALLACARGIDTPEKAAAFFDAGAVFSDPFELPDMRKAVETVNAAVEAGERIAVFGDYDADGVTAAALLVSYLKMREADAFAYIPERLTEGYGMSADAVEKLAADGVKLVITVDNGISCLDEIRLAKTLGMDVVVTDHHKPKAELPEAAAVVDAYRADCRCACREYAGVGVAFKLVCALEGLPAEELIAEYGDLVALGTIADAVNLTGENRTLVKLGLEALNNTARPGLKALIETSRVGGKPVDAVSVGFALAPRINAAGRMGSAARALELLTTENEGTACALALEIEAENEARRKAESEILLDIAAKFEENPCLRYDKIFIAYSQNWHAGVAGIVAARMAESLGRPCIILTGEDGTMRGSCRSIEGFPIYDILQAVSDCLLHFGGHALAAGLELESARVDEFIGRVRETAESIEMPVPLQPIDIKLNPGSLNLAFAEALSLFEPFGNGNAKPVFGLFSMTVEEVLPLAGGKHTKLLLAKGAQKIAAVCFREETQSFPYAAGEVVDLAVAVEKNEYMGKASLGVYVQNIRLSGSDDDAVFRAYRDYEAFMRGGSPPDADAALIPDRELLAKVYRYFKSNPGKRHDMELVARGIGSPDRLCAVLLAVEVLKELGIAVVTPEGTVMLLEKEGKANLDDSAFLTGFQKAVAEV